MATTLEKRLEKGLDFTLGAAILTAEAVEQLVKELVEKGKLAREHGPAVYDAILEKGRPAREALINALRENMPAASSTAGGDEIKALEDRIAILEQQVVVAEPATPFVAESEAEPETEEPRTE